MYSKIKSAKNKIKNPIFENDIDTVFDELNLLLDDIGYRLDLEDGERLDEFNLKNDK